jgi:nucleoid-associated protein
MALSHIIAHRVQRLDPTKEAVISTRDAEWLVDGRIEECFRELKHTMMKRLGKDYGCFSEDRAAHPLSPWLDEYHQEKMSFESFSQKAMKHLALEIDKTEEPLDGFMVLAHERLATSELLHIFFVQHQTGQFIDGDLTINESFYLDTSGIRLAVKIDLDDLYSEDPHRTSAAITLLRWRGEKELSDIFIAFIGFIEKVDVAAETDKFLGVVTDYTKALPDDIAHQTNKQVVDYCLEQNKIGKPVVISELSAQLKENPPVRAEKINSSGEPTPNEAPVDLPEFSNFVSSAQPEAKPEIITDTSKLRQFVRLSGRNNQLSMSFASSCLGDSIVYDPSTDSLTIKDIPPRLKARLIKLAQEDT